MGSSYITGLLVEQRLSELRAEADRERLARTARLGARPRLRGRAAARVRRAPRTRLGLVLQGVGRSAGQV
ncbi:MAG TPA: hypothetical protein VK894_05265 [Jiangellales bacterium]|nr:hypothetical protein [Jiangellales bacterium]